MEILIERTVWVRSREVSVEEVSACVLEGKAEEGRRERVEEGRRGQKERWRELERGVKGRTKGRGEKKDQNLEATHATKAPARMYAGRCFWWDKDAHVRACYRSEIDGFLKLARVWNPVKRAAIVFPIKAGIRSRDWCVAEEGLHYCVRDATLLLSFNVLNALKRSDPCRRESVAVFIQHTLSFRLRPVFTEQFRQRHTDRRTNTGIRKKNETRRDAARRQKASQGYYSGSYYSWSNNIRSLIEVFMFDVNKLFAEQ